MHRGEQLPRFIVERVGDPFRFLLQSLIQATQGLLGALTFSDVASDPQHAHHLSVLDKRGLGKLPMDIHPRLCLDA